MEKITKKMIREYLDVLEAEQNIYAEHEEMLENDEITAAEAAFMRGYLEAG